MKYKCNALSISAFSDSIYTDNVRDRRREQLYVKIDGFYLSCSFFFGLFHVFCSPFSQLVRVGVCCTMKANICLHFTYTTDVIHIQSITYTTEGINNICTV